MILCRWSQLPKSFQNEAVRPYYEHLYRMKHSLMVKRAFDVMMALILLVVLMPLLFIIALLIKLDSKGSVLFKQVRITTYGRPFKIIKFRTMVAGADQKGPQVTVAQDYRITRVGSFLRKNRLDELPQLLNVLRGEMSFVGTRPEAYQYFSYYTDEMRATLLLPAGITSKASVLFRDEASMLSHAECIETTYITEVLPIKMQYNLESLRGFSLLSDLQIMGATLLAVIGIGAKHTTSPLP